MLFLSIKPQYVAKFRNGTKRVELRRRRPRSQSGDWMAIYESSPTMALVAVARISEVRASSPQCLWRRAGKMSGVSKKEFDEYFAGTDQAVGIFIDQPTELPFPVPLSDLRSVWPKFNPPQAFLYLSDEQQKYVFDQFDGLPFALDSVA